MVIGAAAVLLALQAHSGHAAPGPSLPGTSIVNVSPPFFNPSLGQAVSVVFKTTTAGTLTLTVLDRDGFPIRKLPPISSAAGEQKVAWDGRDDKGDVVPDEAYSVRIELAGGDVRAVYDPMTAYSPIVEEPSKRTYSRLDGILGYSLTRSARVHIEAGQAKFDPKSKRAEGPILKTVVDRQPRTSGSVVEKWNGMDESGTIFVPDLPNFVVSIVATSLPLPALITVGNRTQSFESYARSRRSAAELVPRNLKGGRQAHHVGLNAFEDHSPSLTITPSGRFETGVLRLTAGQDLILQLTLDSSRAPFFLKQPNALDVFVDETSVLHREAPAHPAAVTVPGASLGIGEHLVTVNWGSRLGPVAVNAIRILISPEKKAE
jgi:hypothetical protein